MPGSDRRNRAGGDERGVSHVLGVILVVAVVVTGVLAVVGFGLVGVSDSTAEVSETVAERDFAALADEIDRATVHRDTAAGTTTVELSMAEMDATSEWVTVDGEAGELSLAVRSDGTETELANTSLGLVKYERPGSDARIAYQSGLVFSAPDATRPAVVRSGEFSHRSEGGVESLTLHVTRVTGQVVLDRHLDIAAGNTQDLHPGVLLGGDAGTAADELVLSIESAYSEGWERTLRDALPAERTDITREGTTLELVYDVPEAGMFLHASLHEVELGGR